MRTLKRNSGFSLIEVMVVLLIIGIMASMVAPQILGNQEEAQLKKAAVDIQQLESALEMYKLRNNRFPTTEQGLDALVNAPTIDPIPRNYPDGGFIKRLPEDPWGNDYVYIYPGTNNTNSFDIMSYGSDGVQGGGDDIGNWKQPGE